MHKVPLILIGSTGIVGQEILGLISDDGFEPGEIMLVASDDSVGEYYDIGGREVEIKALSSLDIPNNGFIVLCCPKDISAPLIPVLRQKAVAVVDCSGLDMIEHNLEVLPEGIPVETKSKCYSARIAASFMLYSFFQVLGLGKKVQSLSATCMESVSSAGRSGLDELWNQTKAIFNQTPTDPEFFPDQIAFNVLSQVDLMREDGKTVFEKRIEDDIKELGLGAASISISALRVPIMYGSVVTVTFTVDKNISKEDIVKQLSANPRFSIDQDPEHAPTTLDVIGDDKIHVSRLRIESGTVSCYLIADNIKACIARPVVDLYRGLLPLS